MLRLVTIVAAAASLVAGTAVYDESKTTRTIYRDVAIVGGGASGAHAAVRLREDYGKSIVLIETNNRLGGHVSTYTDPDSGLPHDFGVQSYIDYGKAKEFFARFNISTIVPTRNTVTSKYVDFATGEPVTNYQAPTAADQLVALTKYLTLCLQYESMLLPGYDSFPGPGRVPAELLMNFGDFARLHGLEAAVPFIFSTTGLGVGDVTKTDVMTVMQTFGAPMTRALVGDSPFFVPASHRNQDLYERVAALLGRDVLLSSTVVAARRTATGGASLVVRDAATGCLTLVKARRLLLAIEPTAENMAPFAPDRTESAIFDQWRYTREYAAVVRHPALTALAANTSLVNQPALPDAQAGDYPLTLPAPPLVSGFAPLADDLFRVVMVAPQDFDAGRAWELMASAFARLGAAGTLDLAGGDDELEVLAFTDHGPMHLHASPQQYQAGFVQKQYALQGRRSTWYTGGAWSVHFTTILWEFTDTILPKLVKGL